MLGILKFLHVFLLASVKYFITFPYALIIGLDVDQALLIVTLGGVAGFGFFYFLSGFLIRNFSSFKSMVKNMLPQIVRYHLAKFLHSVFRLGKSRSIFNKKNRFLIRLRSKYGFWGIIISTPILLSIPIGAFLLNKYYSRQRYAFAYMIGSIVGWALLFTAIVIIFPHHPG